MHAGIRIHSGPVFQCPATCKAFVVTDTIVYFNGGLIFIPVEIRQKCTAGDIKDGDGLGATDYYAILKS